MQTMSRHRSIVAAAALAGSALLLAACVPPSEPPPTTSPDVRLQVSSAIGGFDRPWEIAFLPDGTPLVTERPGRLVTVAEGARTVIASVPGVVALGEGGLLGLAVDPDFVSTRHVYLCHAAGSGGVVSEVQVVRYRLAEDLSAISQRTVLLDGIEAGAGNRHLGCRLGIGPDAMLWVTTGDAAVPTTPQDPRSRAGKVLRMTTGGAPAPGNPGGAWDPYVYSLGHRNPQGLAFRPSDGAAFVTEHGTGCDDEVNLVVAGGNYGWDPVGPFGGYDESVPMTDPAIPGARAAAWSSGCPTIAPAGATFLDGAQWGDLDGRLAIAVLKGTRLSLMELGPTTVTDVDEQLRDRGRLRSVVQGPEGQLWVAQDASPGALLRITAS